MSKKFKGEYSELIFSSLACGAACLFGYLFCLILVKAGAIEFHMPFGLLFLLFLFVCVFAICFTFFYIRFKKRRKNLEDIYAAVEKINSGDYEVYLDGITGEYRRAADA